MAWYGILMIVFVACTILYLGIIFIADYVIRKRTNNEVANRMAQMKASQLYGFEQMPREEQMELIKLIRKIHRKRI